MAGRKVKDRDRLAYTFTLHTVKDAKLIEYLEDKSITNTVKEALHNQMNGNLNIPSGKVLIDNEELMRLVGLATGNFIPNTQVQIEQPEKQQNPTQQQIQQEKPELTEEEKEKVSKVANKVKIGIGKKIKKN
jgi:hypothetical protein